MANLQDVSVIFPLYLDFHAVLFSLRLTTFFLVGLPLTPKYLVTSWRLYFTQLFLFSQQQQQRDTGLHFFKTQSDNQPL